MPSKVNQLVRQSIVFVMLLLQVQWGSANTPEHAVSYGRELILNLGCDNEEDTDACMQNASVEAIVENTYLHGPDVDGLWQVVFVFDPSKFE